VSTRGEPELEKEKIITKALCRVLAGFKFDEVPDAIESLTMKRKDQMKSKSSDSQT